MAAVGPLRSRPCCRCPWCDLRSRVRSCGRPYGPTSRTMVGIMSSRDPAVTSLHARYRMAWRQLRFTPRTRWVRGEVHRLIATPTSTSPGPTPSSISMARDQSPSLSVRRSGTVAASFDRRTSADGSWHRRWLHRPRGNPPGIVVRPIEGNRFSPRVHVRKSLPSW